MRVKEEVRFPTISVIIPCYNAETTIIACVESVLDQFSEDFKIEIIVVDDGSSDSSLVLLEDYAEKIILLSKPDELSEQGAASARNRGLLKATGEFICFLDSDDYYLPDYLKIMLDGLLRDPEVGFLFCRQMSLSRNGEFAPWTRSVLCKWDEKYHVLHRSKVISTNVIMIKRDVVRKVGIFNINLRNGEDSDYWIRLSEISNGKFIDFYGAVYRIDHSSNQLTSSIKSHDKLILSRKVLVNAYLRALDIEEIDLMKNMIIFRNILYTYLSLKGGKIHTSLRFLYSSCILLMIFPLQYIKYLIGLTTKVQNER